MHSGRTPHATPVVGGPLAALMALTVVLLATLTGNAFSVHVGMTMSPSAQQAPSANQAATVLTGDTSPVAGSASTSLTGASEPTMPMSADGQHLMHTVGACLALLAAIVMLFPLPVRRRTVDLNDSVGAALKRLPDVFAAATWTLPALDPPTSSPVVRT